MRPAQISRSQRQLVKALADLGFKASQCVVAKQLAGDVTINSRVLGAVGPRIAAKTDAFHDGYVSQALDLGPGAAWRRGSPIGWRVAARKAKAMPGFRRKTGISR